MNGHWKALVLTLCLAAAGISGVHAHAKMEKTSPADGAHVPPGLSQLELSFTKPMRLTVVKVQIGNGDSVEPTHELPQNFQTSAKVDIAPLEPGTYSVNWTAVANDGHVMNGAFAFTVDEGPAADAASQPAD